ncbi:MAG: two-component system response regulator BaeR [Lysobacterales bacterium 14-68-21]|jgi:two-component system response regulator BaeR|nr:MAG: two-component system response regulator BaeR [Xanthomonadales bacterium 15-68-25]OZB63599.1 MAG: two-component system response regulator BaeR [Xanthomonadales bacterium 14-68-21]
MDAAVLIVEDEIELARIVGDYVRAAGFRAELVEDGRDALMRLREARYDLVVLDLMLPGLDGLSLCREVRRQSDVPIIMTTAKVEEIDRVLGLDSGADDYLCKPYSPRELMARINAQLRRYRGALGQVPTIEVDEATRTARLRGQPLDLTPTEYDLFALMARRPGVVFSRAQLLDAVRRDTLEVTDRAVDSHIKNLRRKLAAQPGGADIVQSVYGVGYRVEA